MKLKGNKKWFLEQIQSRPFFLSLATAGQCQYWKGSLGNFELFSSTDTQTLRQPTCHCSIIVMAMGQSGHDLRLKIDRANAPN